MSNEKQAELAKRFAEQTNDLKNHVQKRSLDTDEALKFYIKETGSVTAGIDALLYSDAKFRADFNNLPENRKNPLMQVGYDVTATLAKDEIYAEGKRTYERSLDTASNAGGANIIQTSLADTIIFKSEELGQILSLVQKDTIPFGDIEYPRITAKAVAAPIDESTTAWTNMTATTYEVATNGLTKVKYTPRDFGLLAVYTKRLLSKVSPSAIAFFRNYEAQGITRGLEQQILRGSGSGVNYQGILGIATSVPFDTDAYVTLNNATGILGASDTNNLAAVMSRKTWARIKQLRVANDYAISRAIDPVEMMIDDIPVIISNNINASEATSGNVIIGDFNHYLVVNTGTLETLEDPYSNASTRQVNVYHTQQVDMGALIPASFAIFTVTY